MDSLNVTKQEDINYSYYFENSKMTVTLKTSSLRQTNKKKTCALFTEITDDIREKADKKNI